MRRFPRALYPLAAAAAGGCALVLGLDEVRYESHEADAAVDAAGDTPPTPDAEAGSAICGCPVGAQGVVTVADGQANPDHVAVSPTHVYWTTTDSGQSSIVRCALDGSEGPQTIFTTPDVIRSIAYGANHVVWTAGGRVLALRADGKPITCPGDAGANADASAARDAATPVLLSGGTTPGDLAIGSGRVYWADPGNFQRVYWDTLPADCAQDPNFTASATGPRSVQLDSTNVYWAGGASLWTCPFGPCTTPAALVLDAGNARAIAINTTTVYWSVADAVLKASLGARDAGGGATFIGAGDPDRVVADDRELFVIERDPAPGTISRVDVVSATKSVVASGQRAPTSLALDAKHVYWTAKGDGRVLCAAR